MIEALKKLVADLKEESAADLEVERQMLDTDPAMWGAQAAEKGRVGNLKASIATRIEEAMPRTNIETAEKLADVCRAISDRLYESDASETDIRIASRLLLVLARVLEGKAVARAFGAPGDWGYGTKIGKILAGRA